ncbi:protein kinase [Zymoseptoria brevis]|uniref:non-specific serine/threonine protein kinase n=1 Tax=Zymoseptoria brevis TaxID=1047168 RepID=A0A0F4GMY7_9PEZI|nr:protein kinase [Zymoseptoria brevis]
MATAQYICQLDAEPLHRYRAGGYHPVQLGDILHHGRYKILHKLGWGSYSTVWAARDSRHAETPPERTYVAIKIPVATPPREGQECGALMAVAAIAPTHPGRRYLPSLLDDFSLTGPNGVHHCLVLDIVGTSVQDVVENRFNMTRLPGRLARQIAKQVVRGVNCLHDHGIGHGDLHVHNIALDVPPAHSLSTEDFVRIYGAPETVPVVRKDGQPIEAGIPPYLVARGIRKDDLVVDTVNIKIVDFGGAFIQSTTADEIHTPLVVRAPEAIFHDQCVDTRVDLWGLGCMIFELVAGQPPFDNILVTPPSLVRQMLTLTGDALPGRWHAKWQAMSDRCTGRPTIEEDEEEDPRTLQSWLEEVYLEGEGEAGLDRDDLRRVGGLVRSMLRLEPRERVSTRRALRDEWLRW